MKSKRRDMTSMEDVLTEINQILDYLWDDERAHYLSCEPKDREGHVFEAMLVVRRWLDGCT